MIYTIKIQEKVPYFLFLLQTADMVKAKSNFRPTKEKVKMIFFLSRL